MRGVGLIRYSFLCAFLVLPVCGLGQIGDRLDFVTCQISAKNYKEGDTLIIGKNFYGEYYSTIYKKNPNDRFYSAVREKLSEKRLVINGVYQVPKSSYNMPMSFIGKTVIAARTEDNVEYLIDFDEATKKKELVVYPVTFDPKGLLPFDIKATSILIAKRKGFDSSQSFKFYMERAEQSEFQKMKKDEFYARREGPRYAAIVDSLMKIRTLKDTFLVILPVALGPYDFQRSHFPIMDVVMRFHQNVKFLGGENLKFSNFSSFNAIPTSMERAEFFSKLTPLNSYGFREANVLIKAVLEKVELVTSYNYNNVGSAKSEDAHFTFKILEVHAVDSKHFWYNWIGSR